MKIVVIGPQFPDSFAHNVSTGLEDMGQDVLSLDGRLQRHNSGRFSSAVRTYLPKVFPRIETRLQRRVLNSIASFSPDLVLVTYDLFGPEVVSSLKETAKCPVVCWFVDAPANLKSGKLFLCDYDAFFAKEPRLVETMTQKLRLPAHYLPEACNPRWHRRAEPTRKQLDQYGCDIVTQGTAHPYRAKFFEGLLEFDVRIWGTAPGPGLRSSSRRFFQGRFIACEEKAVAFSCAKILVNSMHFTEQDGVNNTLFEAAGCGVFQICDERPTLQEFFKRDEEIVTFRSRDELVEKLRYYLSREDERKQLGLRASQTAHRAHTYERRLTEMLKVLKLS